MPAHSQLLTVGKTTIGLLWIVSGSCFFISGDSSLLEVGRLTFGLTAIAHLIECGIFFPTLRQKPPGTTRSLSENLVLTLVFGVLHYATLKLEATTAADDGSSSASTSS